MSKEGIKKVLNQPPITQEQQIINLLIQLNRKIDSMSSKFDPPSLFR